MSGVIQTSGLSQYEAYTMLRLALSFFLLALIAALFGFGGLAGAFAQIAQVLFFVFLIVFAVSLIVGIGRGRAPPG